MLLHVYVLYIKVVVLLLYLFWLVRLQVGNLINFEYKIRFKNFHFILLD